MIFLPKKTSVDVSLDVNFFMKYYANTLTVIEHYLPCIKERSLLFYFILKATVTKVYVVNVFEFSEENKRNFEEKSHGLNRLLLSIRLKYFVNSSYYSQHTNFEYDQVSDKIKSFEDK